MNAVREIDTGQAEQDEVVIPATSEDVQRASRDHRHLIRRVLRFSLAGYVFCALFMLLRADFTGLLGLTCSALVIMINFLWLEDLVVKTLQPAPQVRAFPVFVRTLARFILFGVALSVSIFVARFNLLSVLLGFSMVVVGIMGEALYSVYLALSGKESL